MARRDEKEGAPRTTFAMRLGDDERRIIEVAASLRGEPLSSYVRRVALEAARLELGSER